MDTVTVMRVCPTHSPAVQAEFTPQSIFTSTPLTVIWGPIGGLFNTVSRERAASLATLTVTAHGLSAGDHVAVYGLGGEGYNIADVEVMSTPTSDTFQYESPGDDEASTPDTDGRVQQIEPGTAVVIEDYTQEAEDEDSLCALLDGLRLDDLCRGCEGGTFLAAADSVDWCLKAVGHVFYRERCTNTLLSGTVTEDGYVTFPAAYDLMPYDSIIRPAPAYLAKHKVIMQRVLLNYLAVFQDPPSQIGLRVGISAQVADSNTDDCSLVWHQRSLKDLKCKSFHTHSQHILGNTQPSEKLTWNFEHEGEYLYLELKLGGVGGDAIFSGLLADTKSKQIKNY